SRLLCAVALQVAARPGALLDRRHDPPRFVSGWCPIDGPAGAFFFGLGRVCAAVHGLVRQHSVAQHCDDHRSPRKAASTVCSAVSSTQPLTRISISILDALSGGGDICDDVSHHSEPFHVTIPTSAMPARNFPTCLPS